MLTPPNPEGGKKLLKDTKINCLERSCNAKALGLKGDQREGGQDRKSQKTPSNEILSLEPKTVPPIPSQQEQREKNKEKGNKEEM